MDPDKRMRNSELLIQEANRAVRRSGLVGTLAFGLCGRTPLSPFSPLLFPSFRSLNIYPGGSGHDTAN
jgi:hypothetical protein